MAEVVIEVGERTLTAKPTILRENPEWDRLHAAAVAYWPDILEYQTHTTRTFPFIVLEGPGFGPTEVSRSLRICRYRGQAKAIEETFAAVKAGLPTPELLAYHYLQTLVAARRSWPCHYQPQQIHC
jgi:hypothetical protein